MDTGAGMLTDVQLDGEHSIQTGMIFPDLIPDDARFEELWDPASRRVFGSCDPSEKPGPWGERFPPRSVEFQYE